MQKKTIKSVTKSEINLPENFSGRFHPTIDDILPVVGAMIQVGNQYFNKLRNGTDLQKTEYRSLTENKKYLRIRTSLGQIARYAKFFFHDSDLGLDKDGNLRKAAEEFPEMYESAKEEASMYIKYIMDNTEFILRKRKCNENGYGDLELDLNREELVINDER